MTGEMPVYPAELIEIEAMRDLLAAAPRSLAARYGLALREIGGATCLALAACPELLLLNRAMGLGLAVPATEGGLDQIVRFYASSGVPWMVPLGPGARPPQLAAWLEARGFAPGYAWMKFERGAEPPLAVHTDLRVEAAEPKHADAFARTFLSGYGAPAGLAGLVAALVGRPGWHCFVAFDGGEPAATGALYARGALCWLGAAATHPEYRRRGAQGALLAARIRRAAELGCTTLVTETGERTDARPSVSYRNILRSGFAEAYVRPNFVSPADTVGS